MRQSLSATLSDHLLREAERFICYPQRARRAPANRRTQETVDRIFRNLAEQRKTFARSPSNRVKKFAPRPAGDGTQVLDDYPAFLDELYCRDLLKAVPGMVARTLKLSKVPLPGVSGSEFAYLQEAANCYLFDLPRAAVALAGAALEDNLRGKLAKSLGKKAVAERDLKGVIEELARTKGLSREGRERADRVRNARNKVLHGGSSYSPDALEIIEDARAAIVELSR